MFLKKTAVVVVADCGVLRVGMVSELSAGRAWHIAAMRPNSSVPNMKMQQSPNDCNRRDHALVPPGDFG